jgi:hypothetical protein
MFSLKFPGEGYVQKDVCFPFGQHIQENVICRIVDADGNNDEILYRLQ